MSDTKTASWIAALERARTELEATLSADAHWRALRGADASADRAVHEQGLAENPVYRCWQQLNGAIEALRRQAPAQPAEAAPGRRRVSLRDVLEQIRGDAGLHDARAGRASSVAEPTAPSHAAPSDPAQPSPSRREGPGPPAPADNALQLPEEATVSFVIREPALPAPIAGPGGDSSALNGPPAKAAEQEAAPGVEAEVTIVPRRR